MENNQLSLPISQEAPRVFLDFPLKTISTDVFREIQRARSFVGVGRKSREHRRRFGGQE